MNERKSISLVTLICCIVTIVCFIISPTLITGFCSGVCTGLFIADTIWRRIYNIDDERDEETYRYDNEEEYDREEFEEEY